MKIPFELIGESIKLLQTQETNNFMSNNQEKTEYFKNNFFLFTWISFGIINSIIFCLIGICIDEGLIQNVNQEIITFFPDYSYLITDKRQFKITLKHLLTMTGGYKWNSEHHNDPIKEFKENKNLIFVFFFVFSLLQLHLLLKNSTKVFLFSLFLLFQN